MDNLDLQNQGINEKFKMVNQRQWENLAEWYEIKDEISLMEKSKKINL